MSEFADLLRIPVRFERNLCSFTVEMPKADIEDAIARGRLKPDYDAWSVLDAYYADHLSDAALEWLVANKVIKHLDRNDAGAILRSVGDWLERCHENEKRR